jgi:hypothetical protein
MQMVAAGTSTIADSLLTTTAYRLREETDILFAKLEEHALNLRSRLMNGMYFSMMMAAATVFLIVSFLLFMVQVGLSWATAFLIGSVILFVAAIAFHLIKK